MSHPVPGREYFERHSEESKAEHHRRMRSDYSIPHELSKAKHRPFVELSRVNRKRIEKIHKANRQRILEKARNVGHRIESGKSKSHAVNKGHHISFE